MSIGDICNREVIVIQKHESLQDAVELMRAHHVGSLVVVERKGKMNLPVGIITDRDIVIEVIAEKVDSNSVTVGDVMSDDLLIARETDDVLDTLQQMRDRGVRRLPIVDLHGGLVGILSADDLLDVISEQIADLVKLIAKEQRREAVLHD
ncbi:MAG: histidine kinase [Gammaproteobacteria bacterium RBG_16_57_12]|nr:MAG: histidine kinase [Gammaproteobacteria bacterium RBG_16_57_12]